MIAHDWNMPSRDVGFAGYVTAFDVDSSYVEAFEIHTVGGDICQELWVPAEELENFNRHIAPPIRVVAWCFDAQFTGLALNGQEMREQKPFLEALEDHALAELIRTNGDVLAVNLPFWLPEAGRLLAAWERVYPGTIGTAGRGGAGEEAQADN